ncbi:MAG: UpxY family transcription antiterminator [Bacteroidales bacterium]|nr:UpxY family transcription antiterminator [Bacteroidales bacterium]
MEEQHWYAYKVYYNKMKEVKETVLRDGFTYYIPVRPILKHDSYDVISENAYEEEPIVPSLIFIRSTKEYMEQIRRNPDSRISVYCAPGTNLPASIPDREMEIFMFVIRTGCRTLEPIDMNFTKGDRVRVTGGMFDGAEGYITRVHGTRRFVVMIEGVAAIATVYIPRHFIEKI